MKTSKFGRKYNYIPDLSDHRDKIYVPKLTVPRPSKADVYATCSPIDDQGQLGSCGLNAAMSALADLEIKAGLPLVEFSRLFAYFNTRLGMGTVLEDSGVYLRDVIKSLMSTGVCEEKYWPYLTAIYQIPPFPWCYLDAAKHMITLYQRILTLDDAKDSIASGFPVIFGIPVYDSFESDEVSKTGIVPMPGPDEAQLGGHAIKMVAYDDDTQYVDFANSWGLGWGNLGYGKLPYKYFETMADDAWEIER